MSALSLVVLGIGHWHAERQVQAFDQAGCRIVTVQDDDPLVARRWADRIGCSAAISVEEALDRARPDLVLVMSRSREIPVVLDAALDRGLPCAVEKPAAVGAAELAPVAERARRLGVLSTVAFVNRLSGFWPLVAKHRARGAFESGLTARFRIINGSAQRYIDEEVPWVVDRAEFGGGSLRNVGAHAVDAALMVLGPGPKLLGASCRQLADIGDVEDHAVALLANDEGTTVGVESGYLYPERDGTDHRWEVLAPGLRIVETQHSLHVTTRDGRTDQPTPDMAGRYDEFARHTVDRLRSGDRSEMDLDAAVRVLELTDRIYQWCAVGDDAHANDAHANGAHSAHSASGVNGAGLSSEVAGSVIRQGFPTLDGGSA